MTNYFDEDRFHENASWSATAFPAPRPQPASSSDRDGRPLPGQPRGHAGVLRDATVSNLHRYIPSFTRTHTAMSVLFLASISECY
jgi:hypothetical protein